jgi:hypothetical protein
LVPDPMTRSEIYARVRKYPSVLVITIVAMVLARIIVPGLHETGHAVACLAEGHLIVEWHPFPIGNYGPHTSCPPVTWPIAAAGTLTSIVAWIFAAYVFVRLLDRLRSAHLFVLVFVAMLWFGWSAWLFEELAGDALHAYSDVPPLHDAGYFVRLTGINPAVASTVMLVVIAVLFWPFARISIRALRTWNI